MKIDINKIIEDWRGSGKVKFIKMERLEDGRYRLLFREGRKKIEPIWVDTLHEADELRQAFGGKNEETYATWPSFLEIYPEYINDIDEKGHQLLQINFLGSRDENRDVNKIDIPEGCGVKTFLNRSKAVCDNKIKKNNKYIVDTETVTMQFENNDEARRLMYFLLTEEQFKGMKWYVRKIVTINNELKKHCKWVRKKAGDGRKSMELQLHYLENVFYQKCLIFDLASAADLMVYKECKLLDLPKKQATSWICADALAQGKVDSDGIKLN